MKKLFILVVMFLSFVFVVVSEEQVTNRFWNNSRNYNQILTVDSILSYAPGLSNFVYGNQKFYQVNNSSDFGFYYSDAIYYEHLLNIYPVFQTGTVISYRWLWGIETFVLSNTYKICGFKFSMYNLDFTFSIMDLGFSWFKYEWSQSVYERNNEWCLLLSPITTGLNYRIMLNKKVDIMIKIGYSMNLIFDNKIYFPNSNVDVSMFLENVFISGIGFTFYTKNFRER